MRRMGLSASLVLLAVGLAVPAAASGSQGGTTRGSFLKQLGLVRWEGPAPAPPALARLYRRQGYLVPDQGAYARAKMGAMARASLRRPPAAGPRIASASPGAFAQWEGVFDPGATPPDTTGAVGPTRYVELVNQRVRISRRDGTVLATASLGALAGKGASVDVTDPQVIWDPGTGRFYAVVLDAGGFLGDRSDGNNVLYFAFSRTASPANASTDWCRYGFLNYGPFLPDYPKLGDSSAFVLVGSNVFDSEGEFASADIAWVSKPPSGTTCPRASSFRFGRLPKSRVPLRLHDGTPAWTPVPANQADSGSTGYVLLTQPVDLCEGCPTSGTFIDVVTVSRNSSGSAVFSLPVGHGLGTPWTPPPAAPQEGSTEVLDTLDGRLTNAVAAVDPSAGGAAIWTQHTVAGGAGSEIRWYEINPSSGLWKQGAISDGGLYVFNGAVSPDRLVNGPTRRFGDAFVLGFNTSSASDPLRIQMVSQWRTAPPSAFAEITASAGPNDDPSCASVCRWGDYSGAAPDPGANPYSNHGRVWLANQWNLDTAVNPDQVDWRTYVWGADPVPFVVLNTPTVLFRKNTGFDVRWTLGNGATVADVWLREAPWNGSLGPPTPQYEDDPNTSEPFAGALGTTYCFSAQSQDADGIEWGFGPERCTVVPLDDRSLARSGSWRRRTGTGFFQGTYTRSSTVGATLTRTGIHARRIELMVMQCPTCGTIRIYWGTKRLHTYSLRASTTRKMVYLEAARFTRVRTGTLRIRIAAAGPVVVDALAVSAV